MAKRKLAIRLILLSLLYPFVVSVPLSAAEADSRWDKVSIPTEGSGGNWVLAKGSDVEHLTRAVDGTLYAYVNPTGTTYRLFKSKDDGITWSYTGGVTDTIVDIATAPDNASLVYYATSSAVYRSTDAGSTFVAFPPNPGGSGAGNVEITSIDVARQDDNHVVAVATRDRDAGQFGGIYILNENDPFRYLTTNLVGFDACAVRFSPGFTAGRQLVAVATDEVDTFVTMKNGDGSWGAAVGNARLSRDNAQPPVPVAVTNTAAIVFPDDYEAYATSGRSHLFIAINAGGGSGDVYRIDGAAAPALSMATDLNIGSGYAQSNLDVTSLAAYGGFSDITLLAGASQSAEVYFSLDAGRNWRRSLKPPTGTSKSSVLMSHDFKSTGVACSATAGSESAFSCSGDFGLTWNERGLIDSAVNPAGILDLAPSPDYLHDNTLFLLTFGGKHSLWRSQSGGITWERVMSSAHTGVDSLGMVSLSPGYGKDGQVLYVAGVSGGNPTIFRSTDNGQSFTGYTTPSAIDVLAVVDDSKLFIGGYDGVSAFIYASTSGGFFFGEKRTVGTQTLKSVVLSPGYEQDKTILLGNANGLVYWSNDDGVSFKSLPQDIATPPLSGNIVVAFDRHFTTNRTIYAASSQANKGIYRFAIGKSHLWDRIDGTLPAGSSLKQLLLSSDGTLYAANANADSGMERSLDPSYSLGPTFESLSRGLESGAKLNNMWLSGNQLWAADTANTRLMTFVDRLARPVVLSSPGDKSGGYGVLINHTIRNVSLDWESLSSATSYKWQLDPDGDFSAVPTGFEGEVDSSSLPLPALEPATTYYWRVRVTQPVLSRWSDKRSFTTAFGEVATGPLLLSPAVSQTAVPRKPVFQWHAVAGADGYELVVGTDATISSPLISRTGDYALPATAWEANITLDYGTTYFWKIRAVSARTKSAWSSVSAFTTELLSTGETPRPTSPSTETPKEKGTTQPSPELPPAPPEAPGSDIPVWVFYLFGSLTTCLVLLLAILLVLVMKLRRF